MRKLFLLAILLPLFSISQKKQITLEDLYKTGTFRGETVAGFAGETMDSLLQAANIKEYNNKLPLEDYTASHDRKKVLIFTKRERIYRHSSKAYSYVYDLSTGKLQKIDTAKLLHAGFSPDGSKVAYVKDNNLYLYDIAANSIKAITTDGKWNYIINGNCDWVYEEEFSFTQAYQWSPKGNYIAYYRFDETNVKEYNMTLYDNAYNEDYRYKYPKAGEENSKVDIYIYHVNTGQKSKAQYEQGDIYIPRIKWTTDDNSLIVFWMNRHQDELKLLLTNASDGSSSVLYQEKNKYYIDINDDWQFLKDGKHYLLTSEMSGYNHIYLYSLDGKTKTQISKGNHEVTAINGVDEKNKRVFYTMAYPRPMDRNLFVTDFTGKKTTQLTQGEGWHRVELNDQFTQLIDYRSDLNTPQSVTLNSIETDKKKGISLKPIKPLGENSKLKARIEEYETGKAEFIRIPNSKGDTLNGWMLKPAGFDPAKKYPVLFCNYGGPGSQQVSNRFGAVNFWHQMLSQKGFIVVSVDNTGTGYRGEEFKKKTYLQLGKYEIEDQIDAAKYIGTMSFVDKNNIGHWGWSYGGFMSSLAITKGNDVFTAAVAVAPVTNWRYYDNIYTERYMRTPQENPGGYDDNSPVNFTDMIKGKYLIIHGTGDDNVHFQNSTQMITALIKSNIDFESAYYPNKNHGISGGTDNTTYHLWSKMTSWILENLGNENTKKLSPPVKPQQKAF
ncbi:MAG: DPP IV N-terminal domain-containing protein [Chitinophagaceae bacterium]|nr:DPP IV N-terminal domain-containing protein [Chitinophagaceae bacterium]